MPFPLTLRSLIGRALRDHTDPEMAARAIAQAMGTLSQGDVRPRQGWIQAQLVPVVVGALDRALGCMDQAALAISRDLALMNPFDLLGQGAFGPDPRVLDWHAQQQARWA